MHHARRPLPDSTAPYRLYTDHAMDHAPRLAITWTSGHGDRGMYMATSWPRTWTWTWTCHRGNMVARRERDE